MNRQHLEVAAGEDSTLTLYARDASNAPLSLTGKTIAWRVGRSPANPESTAPVFTKAGTIVTAASGIFSVPVVAADTAYRSGDYWHEAWATVTATGLAMRVTAGRFRIRPALAA